MNNEGSERPLPKVAKVIDSCTLVINQGSNYGIENGQRFLIYSIGPTVYDPDTEIDLGLLEKVKGSGRVIHVQEKMATLETDMTAPAPLRIKKSNSSRDQRNTGLEIQLATFGWMESMEEHLPPERVPFKDPQIGDVAKPI